MSPRRKRYPLTVETTLCCETADLELALAVGGDSHAAGVRRIVRDSLRVYRKERRKT